MTEIKKSKDYTSGFADVYVTTAMSVGDNDYCHITFCRHVIDNFKVPDDSGNIPKVGMFLEATSSVTVPMSMARNMAQAILNAPVMDPNIVTPYQGEPKTQD
ncbi:hypothetical protein [Cronobacter turicensis]|uniref:hypothetical protein n=1 Tax=Cronobacter turicensis TaxID=413502 RepID=UPI0024C3E53A|nr:hypothetical protein [Cronobacter turicensis]MDK1208261.1 hypothetical protein [Cronobacter turicensis]MDK1216800.1 hypothetical protein [Cronobacter turicensis]MDK1233886.1 hypothetical protein [Cronobacter turicensis]